MNRSQTVKQSLPQWWRERKRKWPWIAAAVLLLLFVIAGIFGEEDKTPGGGTSDAPPALEIPDGLTGTDSESARDRLEELGFTVTIESVDGRMVLVEGNWNVVSASVRDGNTVVLRVAKEETPVTTTPTPVEVPTTATEAPPPVAYTPPPAPEPEVAPEPEPEPAPAPDAYYANCSEAKAAGAAPLRTGDPGYRAGLDRDKDGVACE